VSTELALWATILGACVISNVFRFAPMLLLDTPLLRDPRVQRFLEYASFAVIGGIIGNATLQRSVDAPLSAMFTTTNLTGLTAVLLTFALAARYRRHTLSCLLAGMIVYVALLRLGGGA
jgi:branched-subunit amino acid transport protein